MDMEKKKRLFLIGGVALAAVVAVVLLLIVLGGRGSSYDKHYSAAESAFLRQDYDTALDELQQAIDKKPTEEAYLLMASIYESMGDADQATRVLYLGYSQVGGMKIAAMLDRLKGGAGSASVEDDGAVTVAGVSFPPDTVSVVLSGKGLGNSDLAALCRLTSLQNLSLADNAITEITPIAALEQLSTLQLSDNRISNLSALSGLQGLKTLYLDGNPLQDLTPLHQLSGLRTLSMKNVDISAKDLEALKTALPNCSIFTDAEEEEVRELNLGGRTFRSDVEELNLGGLGLTDISALRECRYLRKLDLRNNNLRDISPLVELLNLEELYLWNNQVSDITPLMSLTKLTKLDVEDNDLRDVTVLEYLTGLRELWLSGNSLRSFSVLGRMGSLTRLGLKNTGLTDAQLESLAGLSGLSELNIEDNPGITMNGYQALAEKLPHCTITHSDLLWSVTLGDKTFTSDATEIDARNSNVRDLGGLEHFTALRVLKLDDNHITDLSPLYGLSELKTLSIRGNAGLPAAEVDKLRDKLPRCEILADEAEEEKPEPTDEPEGGGQPGEPGGTEPGQETDPNAPDPLAIGLGAGAAVSAAGTGSGYAILWCDGDTASRDVRDGFVQRAEELGMNVVYDGAFSKGETDFRGYLSDMQSAGADMVFLAAGDEALSRVLAQAKDMGYDVQFIQIYE